MVDSCDLAGQKLDLRGRNPHVSLAEGRNFTFFGSAAIDSYWNVKKRKKHLDVKTFGTSTTAHLDGRNDFDVCVSEKKLQRNL